jgi:hypothetical protein
MENIGVAVGVVIDKQSKLSLMTDDGTGGGIRIPSMVISKSDGVIILEWLRGAS